MIMRKNELLIFSIIVFISLSLINPGMFISDELCAGNQLRQITNFQQVTYHDPGGYGFYTDSTIDKAITGANYVMHYPLFLALLSYPVHSVFKYIGNDFRLVPLILWIITGFIIVNYLASRIPKLRKILWAIYGISVLGNILLYHNFPMNNLEVFSITFSNILLLGIFGIFVWRFCVLLFDNEQQREFVWISVISCSSLLFWAGTLKDHVLSSLLLLIVAYKIIEFERANNYWDLFIGSLATGLLIWIRPELSIPVVSVITGLIIWKYRKYSLKPLITFIFYTFLGTIPLFMNNYDVTGSPFKFPFQLASSTMGGIHISNNIFEVITIEIPHFFMISISKITPDNIMGILLFPGNGAIGLLTLLLIPLALLITYPLIKHKSLTTPEKILLLLGIGSILIYLFGTSLSFDLHWEAGLVPDLRYFAPVYALFMLTGMSILTRQFTFNYSKLIKNIVLYTPIIGIILLLITILSGRILNMSWSDVNSIVNIITIGLLGIGLIMFIQSMRENTPKYIERIFPIMIGLPLSWQILLMVITQKMYEYPIFIPISELVKKLIFG
jgi:hypothetical protein